VTRSRSPKRRTAATARPGSSCPAIQDDGGGDTTEVVYRLEPHAGGTRFTYEHTGFTGIGGFFMARLLGHVRRTMLTEGLPAALDTVP
jgi:hypothetical protein